MTNETTENFLQVMAEFKWPETKPLEYRLYYNEDGSPKCYTMDDLPGKYVAVDRQTYVSHLWNVQVVDGQLKIIPPKVAVTKLQPAADGVACHVNDITVVVTKDQPHTKWKLFTNETN